jgi:hypothetical protein
MSSQLYLKRERCSFAVLFQFGEGRLLQVGQVDFVRGSEDVDQLVDRSLIVNDLKGAGEELDPFVVQTSDIFVLVTML